MTGTRRTTPATGDARARKSIRAANKASDQMEMELVRFQNGDHEIEFNLDITGDTVWATQQQIADLYEREVSTINEHIQAIVKQGELEISSVIRNFRITAADGKMYDAKHYDLDMILAIGFRVKSPRATQFRKWAYRTLRSYLETGYAINEARLRSDPGTLNKLSAKLRAIRAEEKNIYASVRDFFKDASRDYDVKSQACRKFYATLQDKYLVAATGQTASQLVLSRASHKKPNMGVQTFDGRVPTLTEAQVGKNYLDGDELYILHIICEQFLLYVESLALRGKNMSMAELDKKFDELLAVSDYQVFKGYKDFLKDTAIKHAKAEYAQFAGRIKRDGMAAIAASSS